MGKYILVDMEDDKAKKLAEVISNKTCRKILDYLSENDAYESEIAKQLKIPISTVHYNLQLLLKNNLVEIKDFCWSDKGNKINIYKVAKKAIIIAPKGSDDIKGKLKNLFSIMLLSTSITWVVYLISRIIARNQIAYSVRSSRDVAGVIGTTASYTSNINTIYAYAPWLLLWIIATILIYLYAWRFNRK